MRLMAIVLRLREPSGHATLTSVDIIWGRGADAIILHQAATSSMWTEVFAGEVVSIIHAYSG